MWATTSWLAVKVLCVGKERAHLQVGQRGLVWVARAHLQRGQRGLVRVARARPTLKEPRTGSSARPRWLVLGSALARGVFSGG